MDDDIIMLGPIRFNPKRCEAERQGIVVRFSPMESRLLQFLAMHANTVCTGSQITSGVWGYSEGETGLVKTYIRHLRQKIEQDPLHPAYLLTVPGEGYTLAIP